MKQYSPLGQPQGISQSSFNDEYKKNLILKLQHSVVV